MNNANQTWFMQEYYRGTDVLRAYELLQVGAARTDIWLYAHSHKMGGFYLDFDSYLATPLETIISKSNGSRMILTRPRPPPKHSTPQPV